jgi:hypothetical protein
MPDNRVNLFGLLKNEGKLTKVLVYAAKDTVLDPYEKNTEKTFLNPLAIDALVQQISQEALRWKYVGQLPQNSVQIICELRHENTLKTADKIEIGGISYGVYKGSSKEFTILKRNDYLIAVLERKNE